MCRCIAEGVQRPEVQQHALCQFNGGATWQTGAEKDRQ